MIVSRVKTTTTTSRWGSSRDLTDACYLLSRQILLSARNGQALPRFTLVLVAHAIIHLYCFGSSWSSDLNRGNEELQLASIFMFITNAFVNTIGYIVLIALYRHSVRTIFNRRIPPTLLECLPSFGAHLALLRPLEMCWRYATAPFRVLPDILVLGEVRCGTTTICQHLTSLPGCQQPFCLWKHPELDKKETFYFVGHYLGMVDPLYYRMCFPLSITKWFHQVVLRKPFFTFDGCAQYLTSPTAPHLIAQGYQAAGQPPPVLVACVRDPVDQTISWWRYENNAMLWGSSMGLSEWNKELRSPSYPPSTISEAIDFSLSEQVESSYRRAEMLFQKQQRDKEDSCSFVLPSWAMTWPSGQLSAIGRTGLFAGNIRHYERVFSEYFFGEDFEEECSNKTGTCEKVPRHSTLAYVNVVPLEFLGDESNLVTALTSITKQVSQRQVGHAFENALGRSVDDSHCIPGVHRNASVALVPNHDLEPTEADEDRLTRLFSSDTRDLESMCGIRLGWKTSPKN